MRYLFFASLLLFSTALFAQTGNYFLSHFSPNAERFDNVCFDMAQDERGILYFATKDGIRQFDGRNWDLVQGNGAIYTIQIHEQITYWGGATGFGRIELNEEDLPVIKHLSGKETKDVFQSLSIRSDVFFLNDENIFILDSKKEKSIVIKSTNLTGSFTALFEWLGVPYVSTEKAGVFRIEQNKLIRQGLGLPEKAEVIFYTHHDSYYLLGTSDNRIYIGSEKSGLKEIELQDKAYAEAAVLVSASWIDQNLIALGTLSGGVIFFNPQTGETKEIINYATGLPDNEVFCLLTDKNENLWVAHDYGFTRIAPDLPLRSFSHYPGLQGNLLCARSFQNSVYVGTSLGLFKLDKEEVYDELVYYINVKVKEKKQPIKKKPEIAIQKKEEENQETVQAEKESKKGFFRFLKRKRSNSPEVKEEEKKPEEVKKIEAKETVSGKPAPKKSTYKKEKRTQKILRSSQFVFKKVKGIDAKVNQLIEVQGKLIATGLGGAFNVTDLQAEPILQEPVRYAFASDSMKVLLLSTYNDEIRFIGLTQQAWKLTNLLENLDDQVNYIFEGNKNELWLCAIDKVYKLEIENEFVKNIQTITFSNSNVDETVGMQLNSQVMLVNTGGFFTYNRQKSVIEKDDTLPNPKTYFANGNTIWYRDDHHWSIISESAQQSNLQLLNLFQDLRFITADESMDNLWLITSDNELFKFFGERVTPHKSEYALFLKRMRNPAKRISHQGEIIIDQEKSAITFEVVRPDYVGSQAVEYRYFLKGLHKDWSDWSTNNNVVDFSYLPPADYTLKVQSKDIFGRINEMDPVSFEVVPPYWKRPWFYALEFAVFALLVLLSFRLSTRYRIVSRLLSLLTIILLIQFIQTAIGATFYTKTSPVMDFFVQVFVALLILPVEGYLRKLMLRSLDSSSGLYHFISEEKPLQKDEERKEGQTQ